MTGTRGEITGVGDVVRTLRELGALRPTGTTFVDVGANIGTTSITALTAHGFEHVVACEPEPTNCKLLRLNGVLNDVEERLHVLPVAVSDSNRQAELAVSTTNSGGHRILPNPPERGGGRPRKASLPVETVSLDYLVQRGVLQPDRLGLVWVDAQGQEGHVMRGASALVERQVPFALEFHPKMLAGAQGRHLLEEMIAGAYTHFVDMREPHTSRGSVLLRSATEISSFAEELTARNLRFSDILVVSAKAPRRPKGRRPAARR